jgi:hypothetical protein
MENVTFQEVEFSYGVVEMALIDTGNGFVSMTKAEYDRRQAEQSTPILPA